MEEIARQNDIFNKKMIKITFKISFIKKYLFKIITACKYKKIRFFYIILGKQTIIWDILHLRK